MFQPPPRWRFRPRWLRGYTFETNHAIRSAALPEGTAVVVGLDAASEKWFVVRTQPYRERWAAENVARAGALFYLPEVLETVRIIVRGVRKREFRRRPLFPCYLFVKTGGQWHFLLTAFGVSAIIPGPNGQPGTVSDQAIQSLRERENNGVVVLPRRSTFMAGQPVRLMKGAFSGYVGIYQGQSGSDRSRILMDLIGRKVSTLVSESSLEAA